MDKILPFLTEGLIQFADKVDFTKISDDLDDKPSLDIDALDCVINFLETKG
jgi:hypothetical protein